MIKYGTVHFLFLYVAWKQNDCMCVRQAWLIYEHVVGSEGCSRIWPHESWGGGHQCVPTVAMKISCGPEPRQGSHEHAGLKDRPRIFPGPPSKGERSNPPPPKKKKNVNRVFQRQAISTVPLPWGGAGAFRSAGRPLLSYVLEKGKPSQSMFMVQMYSTATTLSWENCGFNGFIFKVDGAHRGLTTPMRDWSWTKQLENHLILAHICFYSLIQRSREMNRTLESYKW